MEREQEERIREVKEAADREAQAAKKAEAEMRQEMGRKLEDKVRCVVLIDS